MTMFSPPPAPLPSIAAARKSLLPEQAAVVRNGITLFPMRPDAKPVTLELVQRLNEELP